MKISELLQIKPGLTALIGGGGKTSLMYRLAYELSECGAVIVGTSTKIFEPKDLPVLTDGSKEEISAALQSHRVLCVGTKIENGKLSAPSVRFDELKKLADYVIVEADGAHGLPLKAHTAYEPVIPKGTDKTVLVIGADAFGQPICETCHRPELFAQIAGVDIQSVVTPETVKRVIEKERLEDCLYINKVEDEQTKAYAQELANLLDLPVAAGSLRREEYLCLC
ncbi:MAG: putative selenium-dependent hydroxylase accessory protein YqeC [Ruminococcus sp.]|nr:putative selenium-dependent hydroxylase accessory protein YqeC [Ruminococcus sp.]